MEHSERSETFVVFESGQRRLAFNALNVRRMTASELWSGATPLRVGELLGLGSAAGLRERRTRVLELETSDERAVPVLARGPMSIRTVPRNKIRPLRGAIQRGSRMLDGVIEDSGVQMIIVAPDAIQRYVDERANQARPSARAVV